MADLTGLGDGHDKRDKQYKCSLSLFCFCSFKIESNWNKQKQVIWSFLFDWLCIISSYSFVFAFHFISYTYLYKSSLWLTVSVLVSLLKFDLIDQVTKPQTNPVTSKCPVTRSAYSQSVTSTPPTPISEHSSWWSYRHPYFIYSYHRSVCMFSITEGRSDKPLSVIA